MASTPTKGPERFAHELMRCGIAAEVKQLPASTRTAAEAAAAIGCQVDQIAKSIVFRDREKDCAVIVVASGSDRIDLGKVADLMRTTIARADADFVRQQTGYAIGGVPPFGYPQPLPTLIDERLFALGQVWAAAGGPFAVFSTTAEQLLRASGGVRADARIPTR